MSCDVTGFVPLAPSAIDGAGFWDGTGGLGVGVYPVDTTDFGIPAGVKAVEIRLFSVWNGARQKNCAVFARPTGQTGAGKAQVVNWHDGYGTNVDNTGTVACDSNGDFEIQVIQDTCDTVILEIVGYYV